MSPLTNNVFYFSNIVIVIIIVIVQRSSFGTRGKRGSFHLKVVVLAVAVPETGATIIVVVSALSLVMSLVQQVLSLLGFANTMQCNELTKFSRESDIARVRIGGRCQRKSRFDVACDDLQLLLRRRSSASASIPNELRVRDEEAVMRATSFLAMEMIERRKQLRNDFRR